MVPFISALLQLQWKDDVPTARKLIHEARKMDDTCTFAYLTLVGIELQQ
jgi:hypothetical protein